MKKIQLPTPKLSSTNSLEDILFRRRTKRNFSGNPCDINIVSQLLWAAQGVSNKAQGTKTVPSLGRIYPLSFYLIAHKVKGFERGMYKYNSLQHTLEQVSDVDVWDELSYTVKQTLFANASCAIMITADYKHAKEAYGTERFVHFEAGHAAQNMLLQAESMTIDMVPFVGFDSADVKKIVKVPDDEILYFLPFA